MFCYPIGTRTRLASGGPVMLVVDIDPETSRCLCAWRLDDGSAQEGWFPSITLDIVRTFHDLSK